MSFIDNKQLSPKAHMRRDNSFASPTSMCVALRRAFLLWLKSIILQLVQNSARRRETNSSPFGSNTLPRFCQFRENLLTSQNFRDKMFLHPKRGVASFGKKSCLSSGFCRLSQVYRNCGLHGFIDKTFFRPFRWSDRGSVYFFAQPNMCEWWG